MKKALGLLSAGALLIVAAAWTPTARGQTAPTAVCTHVGFVSMDGADAAARIDAAMNAHLAAGREHVTVLTTPPVPGVMVCAY